MVNIKPITLSQVLNVMLDQEILFEEDSTICIMDHETGAHYLRDAEYNFILGGDRCNKNIFDIYNMTVTGIKAGRNGTLSIWVK